MSEETASDGARAPTAATVSVGLSVGQTTFEAADAALLRAVDDGGSVRAAATTLGRSRARALNRLETLEAAFGALVERRRGGADGGGSRLTPDARELLERFDRLQAALAGTARNTESVIRGRVARREGELAVVETSLGAVRAVAVDDPDPGAAVTVSVGADAVTLHDPAGAPTPDATSARNRFDGEVRSADRGDAVVTVVVGVGEETVTALVTAESADRLALADGDPVTVSFKTTATRAVPTTVE